MDFGTEAALTAAERFGLRGAGVGPSRMLVRADDRAIDIVEIPVELLCGIGTRLDRGKEARPEARLAPAIQPAGDGAPGAIPLRQVTPGGAGTQEPEDSVEDASVIDSRAAGFGLLRRQERLESFPLAIGEFMSIHTMKYTAQNRLCKHALAVEHRQLLPQPLLALTQRADPASDCRHVLTNRQVDALNECRVDLPAARRSHLLDRLEGPEHHTVAHAHQAPPADGLDHLGVKQLRQRHPARHCQVVDHPS